VTCSRRGGIFKQTRFCCKFTAKSDSEKKSENYRLTYGEVMGESLVSCFFLTECSSKSMVRISTDGNVVGLFFYTVSQNNNTLNKCPQLPEILTDFQNVFADRLSGKFATNLSYPTYPTTP